MIVLLLPLLLLC